MKEKQIEESFLTKNSQWIGILLGVVVAIPTIFLAMFFNYKNADEKFAWVLYPWLAILLKNGGAGPVLYGISFLQFPLYGYFLGQAYKKSKFLSRLFWIEVLHILMFLLDIFILKVL